MPANRVETNPLTGETTVVAAGSSSRPQDHGRTGTCHFCPGNEEETGREVERIDGADGWRARAWLNPWPVVDEDAGASGSHEVATFSPHHGRTLGALDDEETRTLGELLERRYAAHAAQGRAATHLLVNHGAASGRSVHHPHLQLYALDTTPPRYATEQPRLQGDGCVLCAETLHAPAALLVAESGPVKVLVPRWASKDGELLVVGTHDATIGELAAGLVLAARATEAEEGVSYHVGGHGPPHGTEMHAHIHLTPHPERTCGVGTHTGLTVVRVEPGSAAERLRRQLRP